MKRFLLLVLVAFTFSVNAQVYNNEWIDYSKTYYKFKVGANRISRITQPTLATIGLAGTPVEHFQLWRNGQEVAIYTSVQTGPMGASDYIEFWGEMNDGKPDNVLYREPDYQLNEKWSLQTDTAAFFLTVNPAGNNLRSVPTINNVAGTTLPVEPFFMHTLGNYYKGRISSGRAELVGDSYTYSSSYDYGEGWTSGDVGTGATISVLNQSNLRVYTGAGAPAPVIKINAAGNAVRPRYFKVMVNGDSVYAQTINYYDYAKSVIPITIAQITLNPTNNAANIQITNKCALPSDRMVVAQAELIYPRQFHFGNVTSFPFELPANTAGNYLQIAGFTHGGATPVLYDLTNHMRYVADFSTPALLKFVLQPSAVDRKLVLVSQAAAIILAGNITTFEQRNFIDLKLAANQGDYLIISHPMLTSASDGSNPVENYRAYRSSPQGGSYNAKIYMIDELVDQFGLGIKKNPLSIRNFLRWARANYNAPLKHIFIIGKGVAYPQYRSNENNVDVERLALVPSFGFPASDNLLSADGNSSKPLTPIGRVSVITGDEAATYLHKVQQYEQASVTSSPLIQDKAWMKNVVHVTGASDDGTSAILLSALNGHKKIIEDTLYGGKVHTFTKNSADAIEQLNNAKLTSLFNEGIGLLTYFGHSSANTLEFNLDNPMNYNNPGKYPVFIVMGCNAGNFFNFNPIRFLTTETLSEKYVLAPERGSIAFLASTHLGIVHYLDIYNTKMYSAISRTHYGRTLGEIMDESINQVFNLTTENDFYARFQCEQFTLHGDPALRLYSFPKPDYVIEDHLIKTSPTLITVADSAFKISAQFMNIGQSPDTNIVVEVKRTYPNQTTPQVVRRDTIPGIHYLDSLSYNFPIISTRDKGLNKITITIDPENKVDELYETNNSVTKDIIIYDNEARPVFPYNFSIVGNQDVKMVASTADPFSSMREYIMQLDTTEKFNSPLKLTRTVNTVGGILEFAPGIAFSDSTVYYWRVGPKPPTTDTVWNGSSFIFIANYQHGFNQSHFYQQTKINGNRILIDSVTRKWKYRTIFKNIFSRIGTYVSSGVSQALALSVAIDGDYKTGLTSWFQSLVFNVFDHNTFNPMLNQVVIPGTNVNNLGEGLYKSLSPANASQTASPLRLNFEYRYTDSTKRRRAMEFMRDAIPDGSYVVVRSFLLDSTRFSVAGGYPQKFASHWQADEAVYGAGNTMYDYLKNVVGFSDIDSFNRMRNFALVYKKNDPSFTPRWIFTDGTFDNTTLSVDCPSSDSLGFMTSPLLGPAKAWHDLHWRGRTIDTSGGDGPTVDIIGVRANGSEVNVISGLTLSQNDYDVSFIDPYQFPFLKLQLRNSDSVHYTPYQLDYWRLTYDPVPEGGIKPDFSFQFKDTVEVGEPVSYKVSFKNISDINFDSLLVKLVVIDKNNVAHTILNEKKKPLIVGDTVEVYQTLPTDSLSGVNQVYFEFNPDNDQPEQHHFNNLAFRTLYVKGDTLNPLLDVTFDGVHILNRDIVSSKPDIIVKLKDEAKWMVLNDTSLFTMSVRYPDGTQRRVYFDNDTLKFIPAGQAPNPDNTATINFKPYFQQDGDYELIVSGKDRSDNSAGNIQYKVAFQVINKPMISNMLNYPNPFTTSTAFVFTVTGSEVPQNIRIQILTITGKIVRDITKEELGPLHIGRNITEFKWDGTDQYGQKLANGIYLYRVITNLNGKSLDKYKAEGDNTDKYFNKGYGKMYLMR